MCPARREAAAGEACTTCDTALQRRTRCVTAFVTAKHPEAPPILQWDRLEQRKPVSWYVYHGGSLPKAWNVKAGRHCAVTAVVLQPAAWDAGTDFRHHGDKVFLLPEGARDRNYARGAGFFPESLKSEFHAIRATLEAHVKQPVVEGAETATACGLMLQQGTDWNHLVRVGGKGGIRTAYRLDRWD